MVAVKPPIMLRFCPAARKIMPPGKAASSIPNGRPAKISPTAAYAAPNSRAYSGKVGLLMPSTTEVNRAGR